MNKSGAPKTKIMNGIYKYVLISMMGLVLPIMLLLSLVSIPTSTPAPVAPAEADEESNPLPDARIAAVDIGEDVGVEVVNEIFKISIKINLQSSKNRKNNNELKKWRLPVESLLNYGVLSWQNMTPICFSYLYILKHTPIHPNPIPSNPST